MLANRVGRSRSSGLAPTLVAAFAIALVGCNGGDSSDEKSMGCIAYPGR